jgi:hypothetical protein
MRIRAATPAGTALAELRCGVLDRECDAFDPAPAAAGRPGGGGGGALGSVIGELAGLDEGLLSFRLNQRRSRLYGESL